jgi:hypothetical protein
MLYDNVLSTVRITTVAYPNHQDEEALFLNRVYHTVVTNPQVEKHLFALIGHRVAAELFSTLRKRVPSKCSHRFQHALLSVRAQCLALLVGSGGDLDRVHERV